jgi:hypothetical protein
VPHLSRLVPAALVLSLAVATLGGGSATAEPSGPVRAAASGSTRSTESGATRAAAKQRTPRSVVTTETVKPLPRPMRGRAAVLELGDHLEAVASLNDRSARQLKKLLIDDPTMWLDRSGRLFVKDELPAAGASTTAGTEPTAAAAYPLDQTFALHSLPGSHKTVFLDFDGVAVTSNAWTVQGLPAGTHAGWDPRDDGATFDDHERAGIQEVWARVAEDFAPFDIDVTTQDPGAAALTRTGAADLDYGTHLVVTDSDSAWNALCARNCGGIAWIGAFGMAEQAEQYQLAWVFSDGVADLPKYVTEAATHEIGHTLNLTHDGNATQGYDEGHVPWAPIMGAAYDQGVTQWSKGDYAGANNHQDDVAVIAGRAALRGDEAGSTRATAARLPDGTAYITSRTDVDQYALGTCVDEVTVTATPAQVGADLDIVLRVVDSSGNPVATAAPATTQVQGAEPYPWVDNATINMPQVSGLGATVTETVTTGRFYAVVDGGGARAGGSGDPVADYDDYGSLGAYTLAVTGCTPATISAPGAPTSFVTTLTGADGLVAAWAAPTDDGGADLVGYDVSLDGATPERVSPGTTSRSWPAITTGSHSVTVVAVNGLGAGPDASASVRRDVPSAPVFEHQYIATDPNDGFQYFWTEWTPPVDDGGTPVLSYRFEYEIRPGVWQLVREVPEAPPGSMFVVHGIGVTLSPGAPPAHMRIIAVNEVGDSAPLNVTGQIPGPPRLLGADSITVTSDKLAGTMLVEWTDPFDGGSPILGTKVAFMDDSDQDIYIEDYPLLDVHDVPAGTNSVLFTDVAPGEHLLAIEPYNQYGPRRSGLWVEMPALLPPDWISEFAPVVVSYDRGTSSGTATVSWTAPYTDPDGPILGYDVSVDGAEPVRVTGTSHTLTGLVLGSTHEVSVSAVNAAGPGYPYGPPPFTVLAAPAPVTGLHATVDTSVPANLVVNASWTASSDNGGHEWTPEYLWRLQPVGGAQAPWASTYESTLKAQELAPGSYSLQVKARNATGDSTTTSVPVTVTAPVVPGAVTGLAVHGLNVAAGTATVTWTAPGDGGSPLWSYRVALTDETTGAPRGMGFPATTSYDLTGLEVGHSYLVEVTAQNNVGESATTPVRFTVAGAPGPVTGLSSSADRMARSVTATWSAPTQTGGAAVRSYQVRLDGGAWQLLPAATTSHTFANVATGTHVVEVRADNGAVDGEGQPLLVTALSPVTMLSAPVAPGAVGGLTVVPDAANGRVSLSWSAPADDGGAAVGDYVVVVGTQVLTTSGTSLTVSGLALGTTYRVAVAARNAVGTGAGSGQDILLTTASAAPRIGAAKPGKKGGKTTAVFAWSAPTLLGGSALTGYEVTIVTLKKGRTIASKVYKVAATAKLLEAKLKLKSGITYAAVVRASNSVGWSPASTRSKAVAPR